ncbi:MAG: AI-2E family transporter [Sphaerochaetaceae bacterium]|jgi:AI-2 transport protein TqsA|nr:AI-2E family transporter [Sphaerochaetaceae bacterium]
MINEEYGKQPSSEGKYTKRISYCLMLLTILAVLWVLKATSDMNIQIVLALFIFILFNPFTARLEKLKVPSPIITLIVMCLIVGLVLALTWVFSMTIDSLIGKIPDYVKRVKEFDDYLKSTSIGQWLDMDESSTFLSSIGVDWMNLLLSTLRSVSTSTVSLLKTAVMVFVFVFFLMIERSTIFPKLYMLLPNHDISFVAQFYEKMNRQISKYLSIKTIISLVTGAMFYLGGVLIGFDFALLWGFLAFFLNYIPTIGSIVVTTGGIVIAILQFFPSWGPVIFISCWFVFWDFLIGNVIDPRLQGGKLNLSPFIILIALALWGYIWGIVGMFLAVPMMSIIQIICANTEGGRPIAIFLSGSRIMKKAHDSKDEKINPDIVLPKVK